MSLERTAELAERLHNSHSLRRFINSHVMEKQQRHDREMDSFFLTWCVGEVSTWDESCAQITIVLQADTFQIRRQMAITCRNDSHNSGLTDPVNLSNFPSLSQLQEA